MRSEGQMELKSLSLLLFQDSCELLDVKNSKMSRVFRVEICHVLIVKLFEWSRYFRFAINLLMTIISFIETANFFFYKIY